MKKQQKQTDNKKKKKRTILLATLIPLGAAAVATAVAVPLVLMNKPGEESEEPTSEETLDPAPELAGEAASAIFYTTSSYLKKRVLYTLSFTINDTWALKLAEKGGLKYFRIKYNTEQNTSVNAHFKVTSSDFDGWAMNDENIHFIAPSGKEISAKGTYTIKFYITGDFTDNAWCSMYLSTHSDQP